MFPRLVIEKVVNFKFLRSDYNLINILSLTNEKLNLEAIKDIPPLQLQPYLVWYDQGLMVANVSKL